MNWQNHPLIRLVIPFTMGIVGANHFICHMNSTTLFLLCCTVLFLLCCTLLAILFFFIPHSKGTHQGSTFGILAMTLAFLLGMTLYTEKHHRTAQGIPQDTTFCQGILTELPIEKAHSWALNLQQENGTHIILYIGKNREEPQRDSITYASLQPGDTLLARTKHFQPTEQAQGEHEAYMKYLFHQGICATAYAPYSQCTVHPRQGKPTLLQQAKSLQHQLHQIYDDRGINSEAGSIVEAMTLGRKADLSPTTRQAYAASGVSHVLALSGFHVGIIVLMLQFFFLGKLLPLHWQWVSSILIIIVLWGYALLTGMSPSLVRATLMFTILLVCQIFSHDTLSPNTCVLAFFIMLCINPFYLNDIGFQLSFIAVGSIGILGKRLINLCTFQNNLIHYIWLITMIAISLISTVFTAPLVAYHFGQFSILSLFANLLLFPFIYLIMWGSILWWLFLWCTPINSLLTDLLNWTADTMNRITDAISSLPFATIEWHPNALTTLFCYILLLLMGYFITHLNKKRI
ncbi:MAG: ComEC/Rec2 family competence protein [Bacteroidaceae bacterium]|nr:ComEC/Rec2 family competence protein [Bacteroidaceae bacterium]